MSKAKKVYRAYSKEKVQEALQLIQDGMSVRKASAICGVPKSTLHDRLTNPDVGNFGPETLLPEEEETKLVESALSAAEKGIGWSRLGLMREAGRRLKVLGRLPKTFSGRKWYEGMKNRHPEVTLRKPSGVNGNRLRQMSHEVVDDYFATLTREISRTGLINHPECIWNMDEKGVQLEHKPTKVVARKGAKQVPCRVANSRESITVLACVNASGGSMVPFIVGRGKSPLCLEGFSTDEAPPGSIWAYQSNAWMDDDLGTRWFEDVFLRYCGSDRPQLLILDGHSSHQSIRLLECAMENQISIICLPPHTTHYLQPLDRSVYGPLSTYYDGAVSEFLLNPRSQISKATWPGLFCKAWEGALTKSNIQGGFRGTGIYPLNPSAIPESAFLPSSVPRSVSLPSASLPSTSHPSASLPSASLTPLQSTSSVGADNNLMVLAEAVVEEDDLQKTPDIPSPKRGRLLTSKDVLENKKRRLLLKEEKEKKKENRKGKGKGKGKGKSNWAEMDSDKQEGESDKEEEDTVACIKCNKSTGGTWINCDSCSKWMHQRCVCSLLQPSMKMSISKDLSFICEYCSEMAVEV